MYEKEENKKSITAVNRLILTFFTLFVFFLPYIKIGFFLGRRTFSIPDVFLVLSFFIICLKIMANRFRLRLDRDFRKFLAIQLLFMVLLSFSGFKIVDIMQYLKAFVPHIYALIVTFTFAYIYNEVGDRLFSATNKTIFLTSIISLVPAILSGIGIHLSPFFKVGGAHYTFLCINSSQYATFLGIALSIYLMVHLLKPRKNKLYDTILLLGIFMSFFVVLVTGSKTGAVHLFIIAVVYLFYYFLSSLYIQRPKLKEFLNSYIRVIVVILIICTLLGLAYLTFRTIPKVIGATGRAAKAVKYIKEGRLDEPRGSRLVEGFNVFKKNWFLGIGFGNYYRYYHKMELHSTYISLLAETGIVGFSGFIILLVFLFSRLLSIKCSPLKKLIFVNLSIAYLLINIPHYLLRERWIWLYFQVVIATSVSSRRMRVFR